MPKYQANNEIRGRLEPKKLKGGGTEEHVTNAGDIFEADVADVAHLLSGGSISEVRKTVEEAQPDQVDGAQ